MIQTFMIPGRLPSLNDLSQAMNRNRYAGAKLKRDTETRIAWAVLVAKLLPMDGRVSIHVAWYERDRRRDPDNVQSGVKFILDVLQPGSRRHPNGLGIILGDGQSHITGITHEMVVDRHEPRVVVTLEEAAA